MGLSVCFRFGSEDADGGSAVIFYNDTVRVVGKIVPFVMFQYKPSLFLKPSPFEDIGNHFAHEGIFVGRIAKNEIIRNSRPLQKIFYSNSCGTYLIRYIKILCHAIDMLNIFTVVIYAECLRRTT